MEDLPQHFCSMESWDSCFPVQVAHETPTGTWYDLGCRCRCFVAHSGRLVADGALNRNLIKERNPNLSEVLVNQCDDFFRADDIPPPGGAAGPA